MLNEFDKSIGIVLKTDLPCFCSRNIRGYTQSIAQISGIGILIGAESGIFHHFKQSHGMLSVTAVVSGFGNRNINDFAFAGCCIANADLIFVDISPDSAAGPDDVDIASGAFAPAVESKRE